MGADREVARVRKAALSACVTCPLCRGLFRDATAIGECLHTFCRECIMKEIDDEDVDHCPVCNIDLGCDPEEKLRPDKNLQDIRNKLFPIKGGKIASPKVPTTILPAKRKQRSLSSLVVETPRVEVKAGVTGKRTKTTRRTAPHATSADKNGTMKLPTKPEIQDKSSIEKHTTPQSTKVVTAANKKQRNADVDVLKKPSSEDRKNGKTTDKDEIRNRKNSKTTDEDELRKRKNGKTTDEDELRKRKNGKTTDEDELWKRKNDKTTDKDELRNRKNGKTIDNDELRNRNNGKTADKDELRKALNSSVDPISRTKSPTSSLKIRAVQEQVIKNKEGKLPTRKEGQKNEAVRFGTRVRTQTYKARLREEKKGSSSEPAPSKEKTRTEDHLKKESLGSAGTNALHGAAVTPVWFLLVASPNQKEDPQLPQLSNKYLRIKDGSLKVSSVQRYIMTKLDLKPEEEVEIICHGEPISPSSTLQGLIDLCVRRETGEPVQASLDAPAKDFVMVLGYRRRRQRAPAP